MAKWFFIKMVKAGVSIKIKLKKEMFTLIVDRISIRKEGI